MEEGRPPYAWDGKSLYLRELRHDFRAVYGCPYDDVPTEEAIDLIDTLPDGSAYMSALSPFHAFSDTQEQLASIQDVIWKFLWMKSEAGTTEGAPRVVRPWDEEYRQMVRAAAKAKAYAVRERIENTEWVDVEVDDGNDRPR